jgi:hypothetical protein
LELKIEHRRTELEGKVSYDYYSRPDVDRNNRFFTTSSATYTAFNDYDGNASSSISSNGVDVSLSRGRKNIFPPCNGKVDQNWFLLEGVASCSDEIQNACATS